MITRDRLAFFSMFLSSINKLSFDITEILLKLVLSFHNPNPQASYFGQTIRQVSSFGKITDQVSSGLIRVVGFGKRDYWTHQRMTIIGTNFSFLFVLERPGTYTGKFSSNEPVKKSKKLSSCLMTNFENYFLYA